jgi:hypothetical protein
MNTLRTALIPGLIGGVLSVLGSWLWMGVVFHRFQKETPGTWRAEGTRNYIAASVLHIVAAIGMACLFTLMVRFKVWSPGFGDSIRFALCLWGAVSLPIVLESAFFIRLHPLVVIGQLLDWLTVAVLACVVTGWWIAG